VPRGQGPGVAFSPFDGASSTYLAGIQSLAPEDTLCGNLEVRRVRVDDRGRLPAQFEGERREMLGGGLCHDAGYGSISGVRDWAL